MFDQQMNMVKFEAILGYELHVLKIAKPIFITKCSKYSLLSAAEGYFCCVRRKAFTWSGVISAGWPPQVTRR